jgi:ribosomal protein S18 acetylase RimI-like enzyme
MPGLNGLETARLTRLTSTQAERAMTIAVKPVSPDLHESFVTLLIELHAFYNQPPTASPEEIRAHLLENLLSQAGLCLPVAVDENDQVLGFAALVLMHSLVDANPAHRRQCLLKELYVRSSCRSAGVGKRLMQWSADYAIRSGCGRMDWNVRASNLRGITFYNSLGGHLVEDRLSYRLSRQPLERLARGEV